jgi:hypothetical protein
MAAQLTQPFMNARRTDFAMRASADPAGGVRSGIDSADTLYGAVKAFNQRKNGRTYEQGAPEALFDAVKAFNTRRLGR